MHACSRAPPCGAAYQTWPALPHIVSSLHPPTSTHIPFLDTFTFTGKPPLPSSPHTPPPALHCPHPAPLSAPARALLRPRLLLLVCHKRSPHARQCVSPFIQQQWPGILLLANLHSLKALGPRSSPCNISKNKQAKGNSLHNEMGRICRGNARGGACVGCVGRPNGGTKQTAVRDGG